MKLGLRPKALADIMTQSIQDCLHRRLSGGRSAGFAGYRSPMLRRLSRTVMTLAVAAMLLAGVVAPPATRHQHELPAENLSHSHDHHSGHHGHDHQADFPGFELTSHSWHLHAVLFGFTVTLPDDGPSKDDSHPRGTELVCVRQFQAQPANRASGSSTFDNPLSCSRQLPAQSGSLKPVANDLSQVISPPLCDRARFERSGVLLV